MGPVYEMVPAERQKEAMQFLKDHVFTTPLWLLDTAVLARTGNSPTQTISKVQDMALSHLLSTNTLSKMAVNEAMYGTQAYRLIDYFNELDAVMWTELKNFGAVDVYRRNLQGSYIEKLIDLSAKSGRDYRDVAPLLKVKLEEIKSTVRKAMNRTKDPVTEYHLRYIHDLIENGLKM